MSPITKLSACAITALTLSSPISGLAASGLKPLSVAGITQSQPTPNADDTTQNTDQQDQHDSNAQSDDTPSDHRSNNAQSSDADQNTHSSDTNQAPNHPQQQPASHLDNTPKNTQPTGPNQMPKQGQQQFADSSDTMQSPDTQLTNSAQAAPKNQQPQAGQNAQQ